MEELLNFIDTARDARELKRALAVKLTLEGYVHAEIIKILNITSGFISKWKQAFEAYGVDGILLGYRGSTGYLYKEQRQFVIEWLQQKDHWLVEELSTHLYQQYEVEFKSRQSYYDLFTQAGLSWKKTQKRNPKHNAEAVAVQKKSSTNACSSIRRMWSRAR
jgi:putative transposase